VSDEGFSVLVLSRAGIEYREGTRRVLVGSEVFADGSGITIWPSTIRKWEAPFNLELISESKRAQILTNIVLALSSQGTKIEILR
jgi:hypothetical protein